MLEDHPTQEGILRDPEPPEAGSVFITILSAYFVILALLFLIALFLIWPGMNVVPGIDRLTDDVRLLLVALTSAGLGSVISASTSFISFAGNRRLMRSWGLWYFFRPIIGLATGLIVYAAIRGGILKTDQAVNALNPYAVVAIAALGGFLSKNIVDRLSTYGHQLASFRDNKLP